MLVISEVKDKVEQNVGWNNWDTWRINEFAGNFGCKESKGGFMSKNSFESSLIFDVIGMVN